MDPATLVGVVSAGVGFAVTLKHLYDRVELYIGKSKSVPEVFQTLHANLRVIDKTRKTLSISTGDANPLGDNFSPRDDLVKRLGFLLQRLDKGLVRITPSDGDSKPVLTWKALRSVRFEEEAANLWEQIQGCCNSLFFDRTMVETPAGANPQTRWMPPITDVPRGLQVPLVGRKEILSDITKLLSTGNDWNPPTVVLHGMGGQGKTQLALHFCMKNRERSAESSDGSKQEGYRAILWVDATSEAATRKSFLRIHELIKDSTSVLQNDDARIQEAITIIQGWDLPWLIVFDNYDEPSAFQSPLREYMPVPRGKGAVIVTSRHEEAKSIGVPLDVPPLFKTEALELLRKHVNDKRKFETPGAAKLAETILARLGLHALAIYQAGCFIQGNDCSLAEFLDQYDKERERVMSWTSPIWHYNKKGSGDDQHRIDISVFAAFTLAFDTLQGNDIPSAKIRRFLTICSYLSIKGIPASLFIASNSYEIDALGIFKEQESGALDSDKLQATVKVLRDRGLVQPSIPARKNVFSIHPLVSDWLKLGTGEAHSNEDLQALQLEDGMVAARIVRNCLEAVAKDLPHSYLDIPSDIRQELLPHVLACEPALLQSTRAKDPLDAYVTCHIVAGFLDSCGGAYDVAQRIQEQAIEVLENCDDNKADPDGAKLTSSICLLARILHHRGKHEEAAILLKERLQVVQDSFMGGNLGTISLAELLSSALSHQRMFDEAAAYATKVLAVRNKHHSEDKRALLRCRATLAWIWQHSGKVAEAEREEKAILKEMRTSFEANDLDTMACLNGLGCIYLRQGKLEAAEEALEEAIKGRAAHLGIEHPTTLNVRTNWSMVLASQGCWKKAVWECDRILDAREKQLGKDHISTLVSVANLLEVGKSAPREVFNGDRIATLEARLTAAKTKGLWPAAWTVKKANNITSDWSQRAAEETEGPGQRSLAWQISSIWRPSQTGTRSVTQRPVLPGTGAPGLTLETKLRNFQSQMQQQQ